MLNFTYGYQLMNVSQRIDVGSMGTFCTHSKNIGSKADSYMTRGTFKFAGLKYHQIILEFTFCLTVKILSQTTVTWESNISRNHRRRSIGELNFIASRIRLSDTGIFFSSWNDMVEASSEYLIFFSVTKLKLIKWKLYVREAHCMYINLKYLRHRKVVVNFCLILLTRYFSS